MVALKISTSWRVTAPLRAMSWGLRWFLRTLVWFARGVWAWVTLRPGSRPLRMARAMLLRLTHFILAREQLAALTRRTLPWLLPSAIEARLRSIIPPRVQLPPAPEPEPPLEFSHLSPRAREIHVLFEATLKKQREAA